MKILNSLTIIFLSFGFYAGADTPVDQLHRVNSDASAMMRSLDVYFAREEMKADGTASIRIANLMGVASSSDTDNKVAILTDPGHLDKCQKKYTENDPNANPRVMHLEYAGADCPVSIVGDVTMKKNGNDIDVDFLMKLQILSDELKQQFDIDSVNFPGQAHVRTTVNNGFNVDMKINITASVHSLTLGQVNYTADGDVTLALGNDGMKTSSIMGETYKATSLTRQFRQESQGDMTGATEKYFIDNKEVTKDEFTKAHETLNFPGMDQDKQPLSQPVTCQVRAYDAGAIKLADLRTAIANGTADSLPTVETVPPLSLDETGKIDLPFNNNAWQLEVQTSQDVLHLEFTDQANHQVVGTVTGLLAEKFDLAKTVGNRHIRLNCAPK